MLGPEILGIKASDPDLRAGFARHRGQSPWMVIDELDIPSGVIDGIEFWVIVL